MWNLERELGLRNKQNVNVNDRFNVWYHRKSQFRPTGPTFTSLSTDEASMAKDFIINVLKMGYGVCHPPWSELSIK